MTSVGVMASSVGATAAPVDVLLEPFNNLTAWTTVGTWAIVAARTGNGARATGTPGGAQARYTIPSPNQSAQLTIGFAHRISNATGNRAILQLESDAGTTPHVYVHVLPDGAVEIRRGSSAGALLASSPAATIPINTYKYIELQAVLDDSAGAVTLRVNGTQVAVATNIDIRNAGTKTVFDTVCLLGPGSGINNIFDDLYITTGAGATFKGDITVP
jgi:hypothetical protein